MATTEPMATDSHSSVFAARRADAIEPLHREREREDDRDDRQELRVGREVLLPLRDRDDLELKRRNQAQSMARFDATASLIEVDRGERPVFLLDHRCDCRSARASREELLRRNRARENVAACARMRRAVPRARLDLVERPAQRVVPSARRRKFLSLPSTTESSTPPSPSATTGVPRAIASSGVMPKSSTPGRIRLRARARRSMITIPRYVAQAARRWVPPRARSFSSSGPPPMIDQPPVAASTASMASSTLLVRHERGDDDVIVVALARPAARRETRRRRTDARSPRRGRSSGGCGRGRSSSWRRTASRPRDVVTSHRRSHGASGDRRRALQRLRAREVVVEAVPDVAHRRVAVAEVRLAPRVDALGHAVARRDDEIESARSPTAAPRAERAAGACGSRATRRASGCSDEVWIVRDSIFADTAPGKWKSVKSSASGNDVEDRLRAPPRRRACRSASRGRRRRGASTSFFIASARASTPADTHRSPRTRRRCDRCGSTPPPASRARQLTQRCLPVRSGSSRGGGSSCMAGIMRAQRRQGQRRKAERFEGDRDESRRSQRRAPDAIVALCAFEPRHPTPTPPLLAPGALRLPLPGSSSSASSTPMLRSRSARASAAR